MQIHTKKVFLFFMLFIGCIGFCRLYILPLAQSERHRFMREKRIGLELQIGDTPRQVAQWLDDNRLMFSIYDKGRYRRGNSDNKIPLKYGFSEKTKGKDMGLYQYVIVSRERYSSIACFRQIITYYFYFNDEKKLAHYEIKSVCIDGVI